MKVGSLFSGFGMFDYGLQQAGYEIAWQVEWDAYCQKVLAKNFPLAKRYTDIREVKADELDPIDLLIGGYPCQPFSVAGKRQGAEDDRHLWPEMLRIIAALRPTWVIGENVAGHVRLGLDDVLSDLGSQDYSCQAFIIPACAVGAPHRRDRVWIMAHAEGREPRKQEPGNRWQSACRGSEEIVAHASSPQCTTGAEKQGVISSLPRNRAKFNHVDRPSEARNNVGDSNGISKPGVLPGRQQGLATRLWQGKFEGSGYGAASERATESRLGRDADGLARRLEQVRWPAGLGEPQYDYEPPRVATGVKDRTHRLKGLGNGGMWQIPYIIGRFILEIERGTKDA